MTKIIGDPKYFGDAAVATGEEIKDFFMSSTVLLLMVFNIDVMGVYSKVSLIYQGKDASIVGQAYSKDDLFEGIDSVAESGGSTTKTFLTVSLGLLKTKIIVLDALNYSIVMISIV